MSILNRIEALEKETQPLTECPTCRDWVLPWYERRMDARGNIYYTDMNHNVLGSDEPEPQPCPGCGQQPWKHPSNPSGLAMVIADVTSLLDAEDP
jgi:hypothetical protein